MEDWKDFFKVAQIDTMKNIKKRHQWTLCTVTLVKIYIAQPHMILLKDQRLKTTSWAADKKQ